MTAHNYSLYDKRSSYRFPVKDSSAAVLMAPGNIVSYCLLDVSKTGLAFCYNGRADRNEILNNAVVTFLAENSRSVDISVQIVSDTKLNEDALWLPTKEDRSNVPYLRRCGVRFNSLSPHQEDILNTYIENLKMN
jgi:hypothetical protein